MIYRKTDKTIETNRLLLRLSRIKGRVRLPIQDATKWESNCS